MFKIEKSFFLILLAGVVLAACTSHPIANSDPLPALVDNPYAPQPGDSVMMQSKVEIVSASVVTSEAIPLQISISLAYRLTTPCNQLRVTISQPDSANHILLAIYGVAPKDKPCSLMALSTPQQASISLGSYPTGQYAVWINGVQFGEFTTK